jgi:hypothetical protein
VRDVLARIRRGWKPDPQTVQRMHQDGHGEELNRALRDTSHLTGRREP